MRSFGFLCCFLWMRMQKNNANVKVLPCAMRAMIDREPNFNRTKLTPRGGGLDQQRHTTNYPKRTKASPKKPLMFSARCRFVVLLKIDDNQRQQNTSFQKAGHLLLLRPALTTETIPYHSTSFPQSTTLLVLSLSILNSPYDCETIHEKSATFSSFPWRHFSTVGDWVLPTTHKIG
jgi:hypothetical protein